MFGLQKASHEDQFLKNEKKLQDMIISFNEQEVYFKELFEEHNIPKEELLAFIADPANFDQESWEAIQKMRAEFVQQMKNKLSLIKNPLQTQKNYSEIQQAQQWIPVR